MNKFLMALINSIFIFSSSKTPSVQTKELNYTFVVSIIVLAVLSIYLFSNYNKQKVKLAELSYLNTIQKAIINSGNVLINLKDENLKYILINKGVEEFFQRPISEIIGHDDFSLLNQEIAGVINALDLEVLDKKIPIMREFQYGDKHYKIDKFPVILPNGTYGVGAYVDDNTEAFLRKKDLMQLNAKLAEKEEKLEKTLKDMFYMSYHDTVTDLFNRRYINENLNEIDTASNLPISIIMGDLNGLKQTNDVFGHSEGDLLIQKAAKVMKTVCRDKDFIARIGGDEFLIILPNTDKSTAGKVATQIKHKISKQRIKYLNCSISIGFETKNASEEDIAHIMKKAEEKMYLQKTLDRKRFNSRMIHSILHELHELYPSEKFHGERVSKLCEKMGKLLKLSTSEIRRLKEAAFLHDIGKIILNQEQLNMPELMNEKDSHLIRQQSAIGFRILNSSEETMDIAKYILSHYERWDGSGYPRGLKGEAIPRISRIVALADSYDTMVFKYPDKKSMSKEEAIKYILQNSGSQFDPDLTDIFVKMLYSSKESIDRANDI